MMLVALLMVFVDKMRKEVADITQTATKGAGAMMVWWNCWWHLIRLQ